MKSVDAFQHVSPMPAGSEMRTADTPEPLAYCESVACSFLVTLENETDVTASVTPPQTVRPAPAARRTLRRI
jgi:hypothetical protein